MEVESPATLRQLAEARERNEQLSEKLTNQNEKCRQLEEHIRKSDEFSCNLQHKVRTNEKSTYWFERPQKKGNMFCEILLKKYYIPEKNCILLQVHNDQI